MNPRKMKFDKITKIDSKAKNKNRIAEISGKLIRYYSDPDKKARLSKNLCKYHYYYDVARIGGSMCTTVICANCDTQLYFGNTCADILCDKCASELKVCKHCGQSMD